MERKTKFQIIIFILLVILTFGAIHLERYYHHMFEMLVIIISIIFLLGGVSKLLTTIFLECIEKRKHKKEGSDNE